MAVFHFKVERPLFHVKLLRFQMISIVKNWFNQTMHQILKKSNKLMKQNNDNEKY